MFAHSKDNDRGTRVDNDKVAQLGATALMSSKFDLIFTNLGLVQIAKTIYRHLDLKTLSNCRSVSKSWRTSIGNVSAVCLHFNYKCQLFIYMFFKLGLFTNVVISFQTILESLTNFYAKNWVESVIDIETHGIKNFFGTVTFTIN